MVRFLHAPERYLQIMRDAVPAYDRMQDQVAFASAGATVSRILDLGAGTGETSRRCLQLHPSATVVAIDASQDMLDVAAASVDERVSLRRARLEDELPDGPFDLIVSALAVHHLGGPAKAELFARIRDRLRPGGLFVMADVVICDDTVKRPTPLVAPVDKPDRLDDMLTWLGGAGLEPTLRWSDGDLVVVAARVRAGPQSPG